jgi:chromate transporter
MIDEDKAPTSATDSLGHHSAFEVLRVFLALGLRSFGGPVAHLGYFRDEFVMRRHWLDDATYTDLVALCQFLPGPGSSQVGFSIGLMRAGYLGGLAAWIGFTLPSAIALTAFAYSAHVQMGSVGLGLMHGLKLAAVAVVAQAVVGMARTLCPDWQRASIATVAMVLVLCWSSSISQIGAILLGGVAGLIVCRPCSTGMHVPMVIPVSRLVGRASLATFFVLLIVLPLTLRFHAYSRLALFDAFYRCGALVFGGGHVVLPLLRDAFVTPGWISDDTFLAGYGAAQAVPGPLFTFAAYLGAAAGSASNRIAGAALGLVAIFLPGMLLLMGTLPIWNMLRLRPAAQAALRGVNATVVGLLGAAFYTPVWTHSVRTTSDASVALIGFVLLTTRRSKPLVVVVMCALAGIVLEHTWTL